MAHKAFAGDKKVGQSILGGPEKKLRAFLMPLIPRWLQTYHLTYMTLLWSGLNVFFFYWAKNDRNWLWLVSFMIVCQYITDLMDGAVGRERNTGLIKWGFYMDHFLDYVFLCSLIFGYYLISPPGFGLHFLILLGLTAAFMVNSFLSFAATNQFEIYFFGMGPSEFRVVLILINTAIYFIGTAYTGIVMPILNGVLVLALIILVYVTQKKLWTMDMAQKKKGN